MAEFPVLTIHTDGAARGNPGPAAFSYVIERGDAILVEEAGLLGETTNNQAEYTALVKALEHALELGTQFRIVVHSDSELMVKQLNGEYRVKNEDLRPLYQDASELRRQFAGGVRFVHVRREKNQRADALCNEILDGKRLEMPRAPVKKPPTLRHRAIAILREAGVSAPEAVWEKLAALFKLG